MPPAATGTIPGFMQRCRENGWAIGLDIQPQAAANTNALLAANGMAAILAARNAATIGSCCACPRRAVRDCVMFNLAGCQVPRTMYTPRQIPPFRAAGRADALKPGGVSLQRGAVQRQGDRQCGEKGCGGARRSLPLADYTVLICEFR